MKKVVYIIPGYGENCLHRRGYKRIGEFFAEKGINPIHISINWQKTWPGDFKTFIQDFLDIYKKRKDSEVYVLGFSFGAVIAFLTAKHIKPHHLILCSLSPYFIEDQPTLKPSWLRWWNQSLINSNFSFDIFAKTVKTKTTLFVGDQEDGVCINRARDAKKKIEGSRLILVKDAKHRIGQKEYVNTLEKFIKKL